MTPVALISVPLPPLVRGSAALTACLGSCPHGFAFLPPSPATLPPPSAFLPRISVASCLFCASCQVTAGDPEVMAVWSLP